MQVQGFVWLHFDRHGALVDAAAATRLQAALARPSVTDLLVVSHGWNNDKPDAEKLYGTLLQHVAAALKQKGRDPAAVVVAAVLWPAKAYDSTYDGAEDFLSAAGTNGAQGLDDTGSPAGADAPQEHLDRALAQLREFLAIEDFAKIESAARKAAAREDDAAFELFRQTRQALGYDANETDPELQEDMGLFTRADQSISDAQDLLLAFGAPRTMELAAGVGGAQGLGDAVKSMFHGARSGVVWALNKLTYYTMKKRAGVVGSSLATVLGTLQVDHDVRLHLVGHSFGGRLVTAAANALPHIDHIPFRSLTLLQAAYSHNGLTAGKGPYSGVIGKPSGPISFTHTHNDKACTIAYPIASRLNGDTTKALGDRNDKFGAMGANGPQLAGPFMAPDCTTTDFKPVPGKINRFLADAYVVKTATMSPTSSADAWWRRR